MAGKRKFHLTEQQIQELKAAFSESADGETRTRLQAVRLYGSGYSVRDVREITGCSRRSLLRWCQKYRLEGIASLVDQHQGGNRAMMTAAQVEDVAPFVVAEPGVVEDTAGMGGAFANVGELDLVS